MKLDRKKILIALLLVAATAGRLRAGDRLSIRQPRRPPLRAGQPRRSPGADPEGRSLGLHDLPRRFLAPAHVALPHARRGALRPLGGRASPHEPAAAPGQHGHPVSCPGGHDGGQLRPSAAVAALFALHPLHVESVAWVAERKDVLSTFFFMLTLLAYAKYGRTGRWAHYGSRRALLRAGPDGEADARHRPRGPGASGFLAAETVQPAGPQEPADPSAASRGKDSFSHDRVSIQRRGRIRADPQRRGDALFRRLPGVDPDRERDGFLRHVPRADRLADGARSLLSARR